MTAFPVLAPCKSLQCLKRRPQLPASGEASASTEQPQRPSVSGFLSCLLNRRLTSPLGPPSLGARVVVWLWWSPAASCDPRANKGPRCHCSALSPVDCHHSPGWTLTGWIRCSFLVPSSCIYFSKFSEWLDSPFINRIWKECGHKEMFKGRKYSFKKYCL